jgi:hypothetical protein
MIAGKEWQFKRIWLREIKKEKKAIFISSVESCYSSLSTI